MEEDFIGIDETARITGLTSGGLAQLRYHGTGPRFYKPSPRKVLYRRSEVIAWLEASAQTRTGSAAALAG